MVDRRRPLHGGTAEKGKRHTAAINSVILVTYGCHLVPSHMFSPSSSSTVLSHIETHCISQRLYIPIPSHGCMIISFPPRRTLSAPNCKAITIFQPTLPSEQRRGPGVAALTTAMSREGYPSTSMCTHDRPLRNLSRGNHQPLQPY